SQPDLGQAFAEAAEELVGYGAAGFSQLLAEQAGADEGHGVAGTHLAAVGDVYDQLVHADADHDRRAAAVSQRAGALGGAREAVAVADGQYRDAALARGGIGQAVAQALAGLDAAHLLNAGLEAECGFQTRPAGRVVPARAAHAVEGYTHARVG